jgi:RNA recognition motif-containing protein
MSTVGECSGGIAAGAGPRGFVPFVRVKVGSVMNIYVGNLPFDTGDQDLRALFEPYGSVARASVVLDRETGRSRGFGFVEMASDDDSNAAIKALDGADFAGRKLRVNEARPRDRNGGGGGGGGGGPRRRGGGGRGPR